MSEQADLTTMETEALVEGTQDDLYDGLAGKVVAEVNRPNFGLMLDVFHMNIEEVSIEEAIKKNANRLIDMHFADSN